MLWSQQNFDIKTAMRIGLFLSFVFSFILTLWLEAWMVFSKQNHSSIKWYESMKLSFWRGKSHRNNTCSTFLRDSLIKRSILPFHPLWYICFLSTRLIFFYISFHHFVLWNFVWLRDFCFVHVCFHCKARTLQE